MSARVVNHNGRSFSVKNLGWLLRHWREVQSFDLLEFSHGGLMVAHLRGGGYYLADWASFELMRDWVSRPVFRGVPFFGAKLTLTAEQDDTEVRGNAMVSGDDAADKEVEDGILRRLDSGDVWAWAFVKVRAECGDAVGEDALGACSYADERDFCTLDGYFADMVMSAVAQCKTAHAASTNEVRHVR